MQFDIMHQINGTKTNYNELKTVHFKAENVHDFAWFAGEDYMIHQKTTNDGVIVKMKGMICNVMCMYIYI